MTKIEVHAAPGTSEYQQAGVLPGMPCGLLLGLENELRGALGEAAQNVRWNYVEYPASFGPATGGGPTYDKSVRAGGEQLVADLDNSYNRDPEIRFVLVGYSQGGHVIWEALRILINRAKGLYANVNNWPDPREILNRIVGVVQFGNPTRAPGQSYPGATRTEIGQGITGQYLSQAAQEKFLPAATGGWFEYVVPGDVYSSVVVADSYADEVYRGVQHLATPWDDINEFNQMCLNFVQDGGLVDALIEDGIPVNAMRVLSTAYTFLWFYLGDFPHVHYHDRPVFEGSTSLQHAAGALAARLRPGLG